MTPVRLLGAQVYTALAAKSLTLYSPNKGIDRISNLRSQVINSRTPECCWLLIRWVEREAGPAVRAAAIRLVCVSRELLLSLLNGHVCYVQVLR